VQLKIFLTGQQGQLGHELLAALAPLGKVVGSDRSTLDLTDSDSIRTAIRAVRPDVIVNAAAYTAVDKAESEPELAMKINGIAPGILAEEARGLGAAVLHFSTDYVFDGESSQPYPEDFPVRPLNVYGRTKAHGEAAVRSAGADHLILRTSWVYGLRRRNFLLSMMELAQKQRELRVVNDQIGSPTWSHTIAQATAGALKTFMAGDRKTLSGTFHISAQGETTWWNFACAIMKKLGSRTIVTPITTREYHSPAERPRYSVLDCSKFRNTFNVDLPHWQNAFDTVMEEHIKARLRGNV